MKTFAPSFRFVKQTIVETSSCVIIVQKSSIVFGLGPRKKQVPKTNMKKTQ